VTEHDVLVGYRVRLFTLAEKLGNVSRACRLMGAHRSSYQRLRKQGDRWGLEALNVRERGPRGCPTRSGRTSSSGSWPSRWLTRRSAQADQPSWDRELGERRVDQPRLQVGIPLK
jgi:hypothetical protein